MMVEVFGVNEIWMVVSLLVLCALYFLTGFFVAKSIFSSYGGVRRLSPIPPPPPSFKKDLPSFEESPLVVPRPPVMIKADQTVSGSFRQPPAAPVGHGGASFESL